jgi:hypothetical protein
MKMKSVFESAKLRIKGASIFICVDKVTRQIKVKLTELKSIEQAEHVDEAMVFAIANIIREFEHC